MLNYVHNDKIGPSLNKTTRFTNPDRRRSTCSGWW